MGLKICSDHREENHRVYHVPVMVEETVSHWMTDRDGIYVDATLGGGGHAEALLDRLTEHGCLIGIDRDEESLAEAAERLRRFGLSAILRRCAFSRMGTLISELGIDEVSGVLFDLGISSHQIDCPGRGFSYQLDGPLDMRLGQDGHTRTAAEIVNTYSEQALVELFFRYGEERRSRPIARRICSLRTRVPFERTAQLRDAILSVIPGRMPQKTLARIFQALRIEVNDEIGELEQGLETAISMLKTGGRLAVLSYHSLEDGTVKGVFRNYARGCHCPPGFPVCVCGAQPILKVIGRRMASAEETARNARARSARLRVAEKIQ
ncbi:MAG: 16S rRNA (cytosine(1402)-N(4))-methyltransferase RsmH [Candidatus Latescibacterota bacterium]